MVCLEKKKRDLGVRCLSVMNKALLCKWSWFFWPTKEKLFRSKSLVKSMENMLGGDDPVR